MNGIVGKVLANPHATVAGVLFVAVKPLSNIAIIWFPNYADKIRPTADTLEHLAGFYGITAAGYTGSGAGKAIEAVKKDVAVAIETGNTAILTKKDLPVSVEPPKTAA